MTSRRRSYPRTFKGYVALMHVGGPIIWGSLRPRAEDCRQFFQSHNPGLAPVIARIRISLEQQNLTDNPNRE